MWLTFILVQEANGAPLDPASITLIPAINKSTFTIQDIFRFFFNILILFNFSYSQTVPQTSLTRLLHLQCITHSLYQD